MYTSRLVSLSNSSQHKIAAADLGCYSPAKANTMLARFEPHATIPLPPSATLPTLLLVPWRILTWGIGSSQVINKRLMAGREHMVSSAFSVVISLSLQVRNGAETKLGSTRDRSEMRSRYSSRSRKVTRTLSRFGVCFQGKFLVSGFLFSHTDFRFRMRRLFRGTESLEY